MSTEDGERPKVDGTRESTEASAKIPDNYRSRSQDEGMTWWRFLLLLLAGLVFWGAWELVGSALFFSIFGEPPPDPRFPDM